MAASYRFESVDERTGERGVALARGACDSSGADVTMSHRLSLLVDLASLLGREVDLDSLLELAIERVRVAVAAERATIWLVDAERKDLVSRVATHASLPMRLPQDRGIAGFVARTGEALSVDDAALDARFDDSMDRATGFTTEQILAAPIRERPGAPVRGVLQLLNKEGGAAFDADDLRYLGALAQQLGQALALTTLRAATADEPGVVVQGPFNRIVGRSAVLSAVYERVQLAAQTDATVIFHGETGTGKGLFARAVHVNSSRQNGPFVTVDCTTLPRELVESELFGHERGAFTGADRRVGGKVELAEGGTLFFDEIGELPLEAQGKILRLLQDREFERVGGRTTMRADVRIVCATHRDLREAVRIGRFREDLYFRIRVVEIEVPPLRLRGREEVLALARHFGQMYSARYARPEPSFDASALNALESHAFPGNVRELEHWVESAVVLAPGGMVTASHFPDVAAIDRDASSRSAVAAAVPSAPAQPVLPLSLGLSLDEASRRYAEATVRAAEGNRTEAAKALGIGRNTLARLLGKGRDEGPGKR